ncbi:DNA-binding protein Ewg isoform X6 [Nilaparvata lugens]|uniref:DNA-binding protein Ewg isoform X3 n=1 Tax=Nilaparvata lugens TaxID=108931 RepID=UPI00193E1D9F|nr:DNA-binding protein Ewg isoform X3 [Nilaparvata lugens]XP_039276526.1 DNA-binding protein Ewg isoform X6 [Nilaparvata lugens]
MMDTSAPDPLTLSVASDDDDGCLSSHSSDYGNTADLMAAAMGDEVTAQLAAAGWQKQHLHGPVGMAAAAAIVSAKKRKRPHSFETNPSIRKRQQNRLLRKLRATIDEFATRVGQQAVVLVATPGKPTTSFKCFGAKPLEDVVKNLRSMIMDELESALAQQAPPPIQEDPSLYELPPLIIDGIPTPVEKMTQAQLRAFIPLMLKYSTGRGKPGWGRESTRPPWWPKELPWANVRMDARPEEEKQKISWTHALRQIVINCYKYHGREDLLPAFSEADDNSNAGNQLGGQQQAANQSASQANNQAQTTVTTQYAPAVLQTISNPDGTVSIIQVDPNNPIITLPDGTTAHVQGVATIHTGGADGHTVQGVQLGGGGDGGAGGEGGTTTVAVNLDNVTEATLNQDGQIILTSEDGHGYPVSVSGMVTIPVSASMYQTVVANIQQIHTQSDGTMQVVTPTMVHVPKVEPGSGGGGGGNGGGQGGEVETITTHQLVAMGGGAGGEPQVLQVLSLKDVPGLSKALAAAAAQQQVVTAAAAQEHVKIEDAQTITGDQ